MTKNWFYLTRCKCFVALIVCCLAFALYPSNAAAQTPEATAVPAFKAFTVKTPDGLTISAQEWGNPNGPEILFIHGFSQSHLSWTKQVKSDLAKTFRIITYDYRGHGNSDKPTDPKFYQEGKRLADEVKAVIDTAKLKKPVLVGWSAGGRIVMEYVKAYGDSAIAGINFVSPLVLADVKYFGPGAFLIAGMLNEDLESNINATRAFLKACSVKPLPSDEFEFHLAFNMVVPAKVRLATQGGELAFTPALKALKVPVLATNGAKDTVIVPAMSEDIIKLVTKGKLSIIEDTGHLVFWENPTRFNTELAEFVRSANQQ